MLTNTTQSVLSLDYNDAIHSNFFSFRTRLLATVEQLRRRFKVPIFALLFAIRGEWAYLENANIDFSITGKKRRFVIPKKRYVRPNVKRPSECKSKHVYG